MALIKCEECENDVSDKASACPNCGAPISLSEVAMGRASFYQSKRNEEFFPVLFAQILIVAAAVGIFEKSWLLFGGTIIGLLALFSIPKISRILGALLAGGFGIIGFYFGSC